MRLETAPKTKEISNQNRAKNEEEKKEKAHKNRQITLPKISEKNKNITSKNNKKENKKLRQHWPKLPK
jgi:hypothetical protein